MFLTGDVLAIGAVLEANRRGWRIPQTVAIAGSDDNEFQEQLLPPMTSLRFPRHEIGRLAAAMLIARVRGESPGPAIVDLGFEIMQRAST